MTHKIRTGILIIMAVASSSQLFGQTDNEENLKKELIGTWKFVELRSKDNIKIDTIWHKVIGGWEIPEGPLLTYRIDGTYSKQFTPKNTDNGKWYFDSVKKAIIHRLYYEKPYSFAAKDLIKRGHAKKDKDGIYYEIITDEVIELTNEKLTILEREDRHRTFEKVVD